MSGLIMKGFSVMRAHVLVNAAVSAGQGREVRSAGVVQESIEWRHSGPADRRPVVLPAESLTLH